MSKQKDIVDLILMLYGNTSMLFDDLLLNYNNFLKDTALIKQQTRKSITF